MSFLPQLGHNILNPFKDAVKQYKAADTEIAQIDKQIGKEHAILDSCVQRADQLEGQSLETKNNYMNAINASAVAGAAIALLSRRRRDQAENPENKDQPPLR